MPKSKYTPEEREARRKEAQRKYKQSDKGKKSAEKSRDMKNQKQKEKYWDNVEESREKARKNQHAYYNRSPEKAIESVKKYQRNNKEKVSEYGRKYRQANPDKQKVKGAKRRARKKEALVENSDSIAIKRIYRVADILSKKSGVDYHVDHILPLSKGGIHHEDNLQIIPAYVNLAKNNNLNYQHPSIRHWTELPQFVLDMVDPDKLQSAFDEIENI